ncbi:hypothetical protein B0T16DRAFT_373332 [Cercophora newfieldiana]|uniref:C2H2-type domain-containing protein n=1 Tax=Cercophora newfieldiana TaxID=92897 RepID=A0AA39Y3J6_9PEZI|nr:hypothetical protein B0T16DRAFT_373332 [Cercophora newfieldiana]
MSNAMIYENHVECLKLFTKVAGSIRTQTATRKSPNEHPLDDIILEELDRYKLWAGNTGAANTGGNWTISLDYRLQEAEFLKDQVIRLLQSLSRSLARALSLVNGKSLPFEERLSLAADTPGGSSEESESESPWEISDDDSNHQPDGKGASPQMADVTNRPPMPERPSEMTQLVSSIKHVIVSLYKLPVRRAAPIDRVRGSSSTDVSLYQHFDVLHVRDKFPQADVRLAERLGKLISRRRQLLQYRIAHTERLQPPAPKLEMTKSQEPIQVRSMHAPSSEGWRTPGALMATTSGPSIGEKSARTKTSILRFDPPTMTPDALYAPSVAVSEQSAVSQHTGDNQLWIPPRPKGDNGQPLTHFECPCCGILKYIPLEPERAWVSHVLRDLQPYVCTFEGCDMFDHMFESRDGWFTHELEVHRVEWSCNTCQAPASSTNQRPHLTFSDKAQFIKHMMEVHDFEETAIVSTSEAFSRPAPIIDGECCLCGRHADKLKSHLGRHMEQLALFALPRPPPGPMSGSRNAVVERYSGDVPSYQQLSSNSGSEKRKALYDTSEHAREDSPDQISIPDDENAVSDEQGRDQSWDHIKPELTAYDIPDNKTTSQSPSLQDKERPLTEVEKALLHSLSFSTMEDRKAAIPRNYGDTLRWLFVDTNVKSGFAQWLTSGSGIFWISGKAGSGKSVMMKAISDSPETVEHLLQWSGQRRLVTADYYSWNPGTSLQKSLEGVLRSLLHQVFCRHPSILETAMENIPDWKGPNYTFPISTLRTALLFLVTMSTYRFCFFIDGLDEMETGSELAEFCIQLTRSGNIKFCISSRPWVAFVELLDDFPQLRVQDVTKEDISHFVQAKFQESTSFQELVAISPSQASGILAEIVDESCGSFLWVDLVVRSLLDGLQNYDRLDDLQRRVVEIPPDMESLYHNMLGGIQPQYRRGAAECFDLVRLPGGEFPLDIIAAMWFDHDDGMTYPEAVVRKGVSSMRISAERRVASHCLGLVEVFHDPADAVFPLKVRAIHRTFLDYLRHSEGWIQIEDRRRRTDSASAVLVSLRMVFESLPILDPISWSTNPARWLTETLLVLTSWLGREPVLELDDFDKVATSLAKKHGVEPWSWATSTQHADDQDVPGGKTFMALAIQFQLVTYVECRLDSELVRAKRGRPYLDYALLQGGSLTPDRYIALQFVQCILAAGADPNELWKDRTVWERFLRAVHDKTENRGGHSWLEGEPELVAIAKSLIRHGADKKAGVRVEILNGRITLDVEGILGFPVDDIEVEGPLRPLSLLSSGEGSSSAQDGKGKGKGKGSLLSRVARRLRNRP